VFIETKDDGGDGDNWTTGTISCAKLQSNHHHQQTNIRFLQAGCPSCRPTNSVKALKGSIIKTKLNRKVSYRKQITHWCHKIFDQDQDQGVVESMNIFLSSSLINMQNSVAVCHTVWVYVGGNFCGLS